MMILKVYVAARFSRREEASDLIHRLEAIACVPTSSWVEKGQKVSVLDDPTAQDADRRKWALVDVDNISQCDVMIVFSDSGERSGRGGKHVEFGIAMGLGKPILVIGERENLFQWHPLVKNVKNIEEAVSWIATHQPSVTTPTHWIPRIL